MTEAQGLVVRTSDPAWGGGGVHQGRLPGGGAIWAEAACGVSQGQVYPQCRANVWRWEVDWLPRQPQGNRAGGRGGAFTQWPSPPKCFPKEPCLCRQGPCPPPLTLPSPACFAAFLCGPADSVPCSLPHDAPHPPLSQAQTARASSPASTRRFCGRYRGAETSSWWRACSWRWPSWPCCWCGPCWGCDGVRSGDRGGERGMRAGRAEGGPEACSESRVRAESWGGAMSRGAGLEARRCGWCLRIERGIGIPEASKRGSRPGTGSS